MSNQINIEKNIKDSLQVWNKESSQKEITLEDLLRKDDIPEKIIQQIPEESIKRSILLPGDERFLGNICQGFSFDIIPNQISIEGNACANGDVDVTISIFGFEVTLDGDASIGNDGLCYKARFFGQKISTCLILKDGCLITKGNISIFGFQESWNTNIFCF